MHWRFSAVGLIVLLFAGGCSPFQPSSQSTGPSPSPPTYVLGTAGIVAVADTDGPTQNYTLIDGRTIVIPDTVRLPGASDPEVGDLLLSGTQPVPWLHGLRAGVPQPLPEPADCYAIIGDTWTTPTHVLVSVNSAALGDGVIAFPKAAAWADVDYMQVVGTDQLIGVFNCINEHGEATEHRIGQ